MTRHHFATLHYVSDCLGRIATASERTSVHCKKGPSNFSDMGPWAHTLLFLGKSLDYTIQLRRPPCLNVHLPTKATVRRSNHQKLENFEWQPTLEIASMQSSYVTQNSGVRISISSRVRHLLIGFNTASACKRLGSGMPSACERLGSIGLIKLQSVNQYNIPGLRLFIQKLYL